MHVFDTHMYFKLSQLMELLILMVSILHRICDRNFTSYFVFCLFCFIGLVFFSLTLQWLVDRFESSCQSSVKP